MRTVTTDSTLLLHTRADDGGDIIGTGYGMAVPYGVEIEYEGMRESFAPGAFDTTAVVGKPLAYRHNEPIGVITAATNEADGLYIDFDVVNTSLGRDAATLMRTGSSRGLSVGFAPLESKRTQGKNAIVYTKAALAEVSLTHQPAYSTAGVGSIREDGETMSTETVEDAAPAVVADISAREAIDELRREVRSVVHVAEPVHPLAQFRSYGEYSKAVLEGFESRALFDQVTGDNAGVLPPVWLQQVRGIIDLGRPVITGVGGPQSAGTTGLDINWPYFDSDLTAIVAAQANEKDEVNSVQISIEKGTASSAPTQPARTFPTSCSSGRSRRTSTRTTESWRRPTPRSLTGSSPVTFGTLEPAPSITTCRATLPAQHSGQQCSRPRWIAKTRPASRPVSSTPRRR
jgi:HK97 family phage prohead protease